MTLTNNLVAGSRKFLRQSEKELEVGNLTAASEKAWAALAVRFDTIAQTRNWKYGEMRHYTLMVDRLMGEMAQPKHFVGLFGSAFSLHFNQFSNYKTPRQVATDVKAIKKMLAMLEEVE